MSSFPISATLSLSGFNAGPFNQLAQAAGSLDQALQRSAQQMEQFSAAVERIESPIGGAAQGMGELASGMGELEGSVGGAADGMGEMADATGELEGSIGGVAGSIGEAAGSMGELADGASESGSAMGELGGAVEETSTGLEDMTTGLEDTNTGLTDMSTGIEDTNTGLADMTTAIEDTNTGFEDMITATEDTGTAMEDLSTSTEDTGDAMGILSDSSADTASEMSTLDDSLGDVGTSTDEVGTSVGDLGGAFGTAAEESGEFTGALSGMNEEFPGVTGGLTDTNTLSGNLSGTTNKLTGNMSGLGVGMAGVAGAAIGLFNSYDNLGDAAVAVEGAHAALIRTQGRAQTSVAGLDKMIANLNKKFSDQITGLPELNKAYAAWRALVDKGVTSGAAYDKALQNLRTAQANLTSTTTAGTTAITQLGGKISATEAALIKLVVAENNQANALEAQNQAWLTSVTSIIPSVILGLSGMKGAADGVKTAITAMPAILGKFGAAATVLGGALTSVGSVLTGTIIPALGAIAVPAAAAVAAIVAFVAAVTAIRANIAVFDELGVSIGNTFPQLRTFLDDGRQAFINFSDAINSSISVLLGGFDKLTGGVLNAQKSWDGFTNTLPQGTANVNVLSQGITGLNMILGKAGETAKQGFSKFKILEDGTLKLANGAVVAAGSWRQLDGATVEYVKSAAKVPPVINQSTTAMDAYGATGQKTNVIMKEQSANFSELSNAQKLAVEATNGMIESLSKETEERYKAFLAADAYLRQIEGIVPAAGLSMAAITGMANALKGETAEHAKAVTAAAEYIAKKDLQFLMVARTDAAILAYAAKLKEEEKATGKATEETAKHIKELEKLKQTISEVSAELGFYGNAVNVANRLQLEFNAGALEATKAIQDETFELAHMAGELSVWGNEQQRATAIGNAFIRGLLEQIKAMQKVATDTAAAKGAVLGLRLELGNTASVMNRFNLGMEEGRKSALEFIAGLAKAKGEAAGFRDELVKAATAVTGSLVNMSQKSTEEIQQLIEVAAGIPGAFEKVANELEGMADKIISSLADAAKEGGDAFMTEIEALEESIGQKFSQPIIQELELQANIENAERSIKDALGVFAAMLQNKPLEVALKTEAAQQALAMLQRAVAAAVAEAPAKFKPLQDALNKLAAWKPSDGLNKLPVLLTNVVQEASKMEGGMQSAIQAFDGMFNAAASTTAGLESLRAMFQSVGLEFNTQTGVITDATGQIVGDLTTMSEKAGGAIQGTVVAMDTLGPAGTKARTTLGFEMVALTFLMDKWAQETKQSAIEVSTAFANMSTNTRNSMSTMASGFAIVITALLRIQTDSQRMASTVSGSFSNMAANTRSSMGTMASGFQIIITAFTRTTSEAQRMNTTVSGAMRSMSSSVSSFASGMSSAMSRASSAMATATSRANSLRSAINSLKSKTITITTVYVTIRRTIFAAAGGSFIQSNPGKVGPLSVSEFGQKELVTVTPLQSPGRGTVKGLSNLIQGETAKKARRMLDEEGTKKETGGKKEMVMVRETPIIIQVDGRQIARVVNKRIFEESDALV